MNETETRRFQAFTDREIQELEQALGDGESEAPGVCVKLLAELVTEARERGVPLLRIAGRP